MLSTCDNNDNNDLPEEDNSVERNKDTPSKNDTSINRKLNFSERSNDSPIPNVQINL